MNLEKKGSALALVLGALVLSGSCATPSRSTTGAALPDAFEVAERRVLQLHDELIAVRRDLHRHPELAGQEVRTARVVAERLKRLGLEVRTGVGGHGVVAHLQGALPGPVVALRADMDAVTSDEPDPVEFRSVTPGVRHICGHDIHTTIALAVAEGLAAARTQLAGSVLFIFQPAEENASGARAMLADGVFANPRPEAIFAFHTAPFEVGQIGTIPGMLLAGRDLVTITLRGAGDLAEAGREVVSLITGLDTVRGAEAGGLITGDFVMTSIRTSQAGPGAEQWTVKAHLATRTEEAGARARDALARGLEEIGGEVITYRLEHQVRVVAGVTNDAHLEGSARRAIRAVVGDANLLVLPGLFPTASEDFGSFQEQVPGVMFALGVSNSAKGTVGLPHEPDYVPDEDAIHVGARTMLAVLLDYLGGRRF